MHRITVVVAFVVLAAPAVASAQNFGDVTVSETDYATYRKLSYANALRTARDFYDRANAAKHKADFDAEVKAAGWTTERIDQVGQALAEAADILASDKGEQDNPDPQSTKDALAALDKATLATAKAHYKELRGGSDDQSRAETQVRKEREEAAAGTPVTAEQLQGTWVPDLDATIADIAPGMAADKAMRDSFARTTEGMSYQFGPGDTVISNSKGGDGKPRAEKGTFRLDGRKLLVKETGGRREHELEVAMKGKLLSLGRGMGKVLYRKQ